MAPSRLTGDFPNYVSDHLVAGADLSTIQALAGRTDPATTARYDRRPGRWYRSSLRPFVVGCLWLAGRRRLWGQSAHDDVCCAGKAVDASRVDGVEGAGPSSFHLHETDSCQGGNVVTDRGLTHWQRSGEFSYRGCVALLRQYGNDLDSSRVRKSADPVGVQFHRGVEGLSGGQS